MVAGYTPGKTATISTTVYQLWRTGDDLLAYKWVAVNIAISFVVLIALNILEHRNKTKSGINLSAGIEEVR
jgi:molybdate transport system permease protein